MDISKMLIWNVRGLNNKSRRDSVRSLIDYVKPDVVCLQETKKENISRRTVMSTLGADFDEFVFLPADGSRGGILVAWKGICVQGYCIKGGCFFCFCSVPAE
jgi:exonuclease III